MVVQTYINFNGNCREAVEFYASVFKSEKPQMMFFGDMPSGGGTPMPEELKKLVMHANLKIGESTVLFSDTTPERAVTAGNNMNLIVLSNSIDEVTAAFHQLKEGGKVTMELGETFFSKCYGKVVDKFGIGWQFNCEK